MSQAMRGRRHSAETRPLLQPREQSGRSFRFEFLGVTGVSSCIVRVWEERQDVALWAEREVGLTSAMREVTPVMHVTPYAR